MTTLSEQAVPLAERIQEDRTQHAAGRPVQEKVPGQGVLTVIGAVFFGIAWVIGLAVSILGYIAGAIRYGYAQGRVAWVQPPPKRPSQPQPAPGG